MNRKNLPIPSLVFLPLLAACGENSLNVSERTGTEISRAVEGRPAPGGDATCLPPESVVAGIEYTCAGGEKRKGTYVAALVTPGPSAGPALEPSPAASPVPLAPCRADGETGCIASADFPAVDKAKLVTLASKIVSGTTLLGVNGNALARPADCALDGATGCVATVGFPAVNLSLLSPGVIKKDTTIAGVTGAYPSAAHPLAGDTNATDLTSLGANTPAGAYEFFDAAGNRYAGSVLDAGTITIGTAPQSFGASLYRPFTVPGSANLLPSNILNGVNILGVTGNVTLPAAAAVRSNASFGPLGGTSGSLADCALDGATGCVANSDFRAADMTQAVMGNIRFGATVAGVGGNVSPRPSDCTAQGETSCVSTATYPAVRAPYTLLAETFDSALPATFLETGSGNVHPATSINAGRYAISPAANVNDSWMNTRSVAAYNFADASFAAEVVQTAARTSNSETDVCVYFYDDNETTGFGWACVYTTGTSNLAFAYRVGAASTNSTTIAYNGTSHRWWRVRVDSAFNALLWETSVDGTSWTVQRAVSFPFTHSRKAKVAVESGLWASMTTPGTALFDNVTLRYHGRAP